MKRSLPLVVIALLSLWILYLWMPVVHYRFLDIPLFVVGVVFVLLLLTLSDTKKKNKALLPLTWRKPLAFTLGGLLAYVTLGPLLSSWALFWHADYRNLIGEVKQGKTLHHQIAPISVDQVRVVDQDLAYLLGEKIIGTQAALGSQVELGTFCIQKVKGDLYWVAPLLHSGFFKWLNQPQGTPGYVMVSATNERDVRLVQTLDNQPIYLKYQPEAYFGSYLQRHVYLNGYASTGLTDYTFEIDDNGRPYWVVSRFDKKVGFMGEDATGVVVVDAQTGAINDYDLAQMPAWIDRAQPIDFVETQLDDWGELVHGYFNFSNADKLTSTEGLTLVYGPDGRAYWYTGLTSVGGDESCVGFVLIDSRTKKTTFYRQSGATEAAAMQSAEGKVQEKKYSATLPIPYTINGIPTYVMTLKDDGGLVKMYAMVALHDYTIVGVGNTLRETLSAFKSAYSSGNNGFDPAQNQKAQTLTTKVIRIGTDVRNGNTYYYLMLDGQTAQFVATSALSSALPVTQVGDEVEVGFDRDKQDIQDLTYFANLSLKPKAEAPLPSSTTAQPNQK